MPGQASWFLSFLRRWNIALKAFLILIPDFFEALITGPPTLATVTYNDCTMMLAGVVG